MRKLFYTRNTIAVYATTEPGAPKPKLDNEKPQGKTMPYDEMVKSWQEG